MYVYVKLYTQRQTIVMSTTATSESIDYCRIQLWDHSLSSPGAVWLSDYVLADDIYVDIFLFVCNFQQDSLKREKEREHVIPQLDSLLSVGSTAISSQSHGGFQGTSAW